MQFARTYPEVTIANVQRDSLEIHFQDVIVALEDHVAANLHINWLGTNANWLDAQKIRIVRKKQLVSKLPEEFRIVPVLQDTGTTLMDLARTLTNVPKDLAIPVAEMLNARISQDRLPAFVQVELLGILTEELVCQQDFNAPLIPNVGITKSAKTTESVSAPLPSSQTTKMGTFAKVHAKSLDVA